MIKTQNPSPIEWKSILSKHLRFIWDTTHHKCSFILKKNNLDNSS